MKGRFLALEGIDGCGKTTQIQYLANWLPDSGLMPKGTNLQITREPGGTNLGIEIRELLLNPPKGKSPKPITELLLYAADRAQHVSEVIIPALNRGDWVLSDRFSGSTLAYQGYGRNIKLELIEQLEDIATQGLSPDITLLLDLPLEASLARRKNINNDRIEAEGTEFLRKVISGFSCIANNRKWLKIPAHLNTTLVRAKIQSALRENLPLP